MKEEFDRANPPPKPTQPMVIINDNILGAPPKPKPKEPNYIYPSANYPIQNPYNSTSAYMTAPTNNGVPIINKYNISVQGMDGNITSTANIFEDILPESNVAMNRMTTLGERIILHSYIRSILLKRGDGENVSFTDKKPELINLLSHMKMMEINPYHFSRITNNQYKTMADNFVMFRSCYPIRLDKKANRLSCATDDLGANIRVYSMSVYDDLANNINTQGLLKVYSEAWREILFYLYIREEILKKKICPHFPFIHSYYIAENSGIDFDKIKEIKNTTNFKNQDFMETNKKIKNSLFVDTIQQMITHGHAQIAKINTDLLEKKKKPEVFKFNPNTKVRMISNDTVNVDNKNFDINKRSNKCIVAITEAPDVNIIDWSTRTYSIEEGPIKRQINSGVHSDITWKSVIFQILVAFTVMHEKKIAIREFSWGKNIFIKSFNDTGAIGYWKYKIKNVDFYVPNMKALVIFDSCYDKIENGYSDKLDKINFKTVGNFYETPSSFNADGFNMEVMTDEKKQVEDELKKCFQSIFDKNAFGKAFQMYGGMEPSPEILKLIDDIGSSNYNNYNGTGNNVVSLVDIFINNFGFFLHNKMGTVVEQNDLQQLYEPAYQINEIKQGDLVAYNDGPNEETYKWGLYIGANAPQHNILILQNKSYVSKQMHSQELRRAYGTILQTFKPDHKLTSEDELLETYTVMY